MGHPGRVFGLKTSKLVQRLSDDVLSKYPISDSLGREQVTNFINEDGLYEMASPFISINLFSRLRTSQDLSDTQRCSTFYTINLTQQTSQMEILR